MEQDPRNISTLDRRKSVRFSNATEEYLFEPDVSARSCTTESTNTTVADENIFRVPKVSRSKNFLGDANVNVFHHDQVTSTHVENVKMAISPGTNATESKREAKLRKLLEMQQNRQLLKAWKDDHPPTTPKIDLAKTEHSFIGSSSKVDTSKLPNSQFHYTVPEPRFSDISCIRPSDSTFSVDHTKGPSNIVCSTPLRNPSPAMGMHAAMLKTSESELTAPLPASHVSSTIKEMVLASDEDYFITKEERTQHQMEALAVWCAMILRSQYDDDELDIGSTKQEANKVLQDLLAKSKTRKSSSTTENKPFRYADFLKKQKRDSIRESALRLFNSSDVPVLIRNAVNNRTFSIRADCSVYSDLRLQTTLLRLFLSFHPAWLHLGLETVFKTEIKIGDGEVFAQVISRFIVQRLFSDPKIMKNKKYAIGCGKLIVTDAGREALHAHFLLYTCWFLYFVEAAKATSVIKHNPRMFAKNSAFKCMDDVFAELSREVLSGSGAPMNKVFARMGFKPCFKQGFADDYNYKVSEFADLTDGVILGKLIELVTSCPPGSLISRLRNPGGDRLRKIGNVKVCLQVAAERGVDVGAIKAESIVATNKEAILEVLWKLVGVYVGADEERNLRRASLALADGQGGKFALGVVPEGAAGEEIVLHLCKQIGYQLGMKVDSLKDLRDGQLLAGAWRLYNVNAPDIRLYPGETLLEKVANAAETDLGVPWGLHHSMGLFAHLYLSRLFSIRELYDAATRIQRAYRSYRLLKAIKNYLSSDQYNAEKMRRAAAGASFSMAGDHSLMATYTVAPGDNEGSVFVESPTVGESTQPLDFASQTGIENESVNRGDQLRRALSMLRDEIEAGKLRSIEERERRANEALFIHLTVKLQALVRGFLARKRFQALLTERKAEEKANIERRAATKIQALVRGFLARKRFQALLEEKEAQEKVKTERFAAAKIQKAFRDYQLRKTKRNERNEMLAKVNKAVTIIQSLFRMRQAKKKLKKLREEKAVEEKREFERRNAAAITIQSLFRAYLAKKKLEKLKEEKALREKLEFDRRTKAAIIIQSYIRMFIARKILNKLKEEKVRHEAVREAAAIVIQTCWRGWIARCKLKEMQEERRLEQERRRRDQAVSTIQRAYRAYRLREEARVMRREKWLQIEKAVVGIQRYVRGMLARKRVAEMAAERKKYVRSVALVQSSVRGFLARCRTKTMLAECERQRAENDAVFDDTQEQSPSTSTENVEESDIDLERLRRLQRNVRENERKQKYYSSLLEACERKLSEEDSSDGQGRTVVSQPSAHSSRPVRTLADQITAAIKIQAWFRGNRTRAELREHLHRRRSYMRAYLENVAAEEPNDVAGSMALDARPVHAKIQDAVEMLFDPKMYISKVGAFILNRLTALSPHLCTYFVVNADGLVALLDIFGQKTTGRGPATAEILTILSDVFLRVLEVSFSIPCIYIFFVRILRGHWKL
ncbi:hypothetical protein ANCCAN_10881 [Ancylostoma caninum]|uniref:Calponin-homology (CH) domain-containing protein n=1 Tax=Ancylostoma caninum TaxID=29170 RepID=A0A368GFH1_ANCCA|nr:hypothetical protein ANCCAN_10881 [Ancylostoma caninum]